MPYKTRSWSRRLVLLLARIVHGGSLPLSSSSTRRKPKKSRVTLLLSIIILIAVVALLYFGRQYRRAEVESVLKGFIRFSSYRTSGNEFVAIGLSALRLRSHTRFHGCYWLDSDASEGDEIPGRLKALYPGEHHDLEYETLILQCTLGRPTSAPDGGGRLFLRIDHHTLLGHHEAPGAFAFLRSARKNQRTGKAGFLAPAPPFRHHVLYCSPPLHSEVHPGRLYEWLEYHLHLGIDYVVIYDAGGVTDDVAQVLLPYERDGLLEVRDVGDVADLDVWLYGQVMLVNDCVYSARYSAQWVVSFDMDEFFNADNPPPPGLAQARAEVAKSEIAAAENWERQVARMRWRERSVSRGKRGGGGGGGGGAEGDEPEKQRRQEEEERVKYEGGGESDSGAAESDTFSDQLRDLLPSHLKRFWLSSRAERGTKSAKEKDRGRREQKEGRDRRMREQYTKLKKRKTVEEVKRSEEEREEVLAEQLRQQQEQLTILRAHREHITAVSSRDKLIPLVLDTYGGAAYISFGTMWWDTERCIPEGESKGPWALQRMFYHWPHIYCLNQDLFPRTEMCLDYYGHRKYAVDPRKVRSLQIHKPVLNDTFGYELDASIAKMNHFQGYIAKHTNSCAEIIKLDDPIVWWARGQELGQIAIEAQKDPRAKFEPLEEEVERTSA